MKVFLSALLFTAAIPLFSGCAYDDRADRGYRDDSRTERRDEGRRDDGDDRRAGRRDDGDKDRTERRNDR